MGEERKEKRRCSEEDINNREELADGWEIGKAVEVDSFVSRRAAVFGIREG